MRLRILRKKVTIKEWVNDGTDGGAYREVEKEEIVDILQYAMISLCCGCEPRWIDVPIVEED